MTDLFDMANDNERKQKMAKTNVRHDHGFVPTGPLKDWLIIKGYSNSEAANILGERVGALHGWLRKGMMPARIPSRIILQEKLDRRSAQTATMMVAVCLVPGDKAEVFIKMSEALGVALQKVPLP